MKKVWNDDAVCAEEPMGRVELKINVEGLYASLDGEELSITLPSFETAPVFNEMWVAQVKRTGITDRDLDDLAETMFVELRAKQLARLFAERMR